MKKTVFYFLLAGSLVIPALADLIVIQDIEQTGATAPVKAEMQMKLKGDKVRMDVGNQGTTIVNMTTGDVTMLMHQQKASMELPGATVKAMSQKLAASNPEMEKSLGAPKPTGKKQKINGFDAEEYVLKTANGDIILWLAKNVPNQDILVKQFEKLSATGTQTGAPKLDYSSLPGFPIRTELSSPQMGKSSVTIRSIQEVSLPDSDFVTPADYKKAPVPGMGK